MKNIRLLRLRVKLNHLLNIKHWKYVGDFRYCGNTIEKYNLYYNNSGYDFYYITDNTITVRQLLKIKTNEKDNYNAIN